MISWWQDFDAGELLKELINTAQQASRMSGTVFTNETVAQIRSLIETLRDVARRNTLLNNELGDASAPSTIESNISSIHARIKRKLESYVVIETLMENSEKFIVDVDLSDSVAHLKQLILTQKQYTKGIKSLIFKSMELRNDFTLSSYCIQSGDPISISFDMTSNGGMFTSVLLLRSTHNRELAALFLVR